MSRRRLALPEPPSRSRIPQVSDDVLSGPWFRAHHPDNGPWFFASSAVDDGEGGRFDLHAPHGTCYLATDPQVALRERLGIVAVGRPLTAALVSTSAVSVMTLTAAHRRDVADTTHPDAAEAITREIATTVDYARTRRWAAYWYDDERRTGVCYEPRFSTGPAKSLGLFGRAGPATHRSRRLPASEVFRTRGVAAISRRAADVLPD